MCLQLYKSTLALAQSDLNINGAQLLTSLFLPFNGSMAQYSGGGRS